MVKEPDCRWISVQTSMTMMQVSELKKSVERGHNKVKVYMGIDIQLLSEKGTFARGDATASYYSHVRCF